MSRKVGESPPKMQLAAWVDRQTYDRVKALSEANDRSLNGEVRRAIRAYLEAQNGDGEAD